MKSNQITAIGVSIIAIGVVAGGINWGVKEYDKSKKEGVRNLCMGYGSKYKMYMDIANERTYSEPLVASEALKEAQKSLNNCLAEKGYSLSY